MMKLTLSPAAAGLLRAFLRRGGIDRDRILLTEFTSTDWQSLTFVGERHEMILRVPGPGADGLAARLTQELGEGDFSIPGQIVADIALACPPARNRDGSVTLSIEALTIFE